MNLEGEGGADSNRFNESREVRQVGEAYGVEDLN